MTMQDAWTDRLSEYLDDELDAGERRELERTSPDARPARPRSAS